MSKQADKVNVHAPSLRYWDLSQKASRILSAKYDLSAKPASNSGDKSRGRSEQRDVHTPGVPLFLKQPVHPMRLSLALSIVGMYVEKARQSAEGRVRVLTTKGDFLSVKAGVIVLGSPNDGVVLGIVALKNDVPGKHASPCPARNLAQDLEGALASPKIGQVKADIGIDYANQGNQGQIQALGDHLGADEDIGLMSHKLIQYLLVGILSPGDIAIPAQKGRLGKGAAGRLLHRLDANAQKLDPVAPALGAEIGNRGAIIALMADHVLAHRVVG